MTVVLPAHFTLPPVELLIADAGRSVIRAKILRASRLYCKRSHSFNHITVLFSFPEVLMFWKNVRPSSLICPVL